MASELYNGLFSYQDRKIEIKNNKKNFYVKNEDLEREILACQETGRVSEKLGQMFQKMCYRVSFMPQFRYDSTDDRNDCVAHAIEVLCEQYKEYEVERKANCFSFVTMVAMNGLRAGWNILKKNSMETLRFDMVFDESV